VRFVNYAYATVRIVRRSRDGKHIRATEVSLLKTAERVQANEASLVSLCSTSANQGLRESDSD
jgi:hypothetical protein